MKYYYTTIIISVITVLFLLGVSSASNAEEYIITYEAKFESDGCRVLSIDGPHHPHVSKPTPVVAKPFYNVYRFCNGSKPPETAFVYVQQVNLIDIKDLK